MRTLRELYEEALDVPAGQRERWLREQCADEALRARVLALLQAEHDTGDHLLDRPPAERMAAFDDDDRSTGRWIGRKVGAFRLQRLIGQGGMAAVFLAQREDADFRQQVAIKLLQRGLFSELEQQLFRRERRALASLSHPNIARLIDGGIAEGGVPYLAMDYVDGAPITRYCAERRCDLRARLALFVMVCRAVDAAHRALIVHRDIKPSNILVTADGVVKLLDFGIAKLLRADGESPTHTAMTALTPEYAAPEQFDGGVITTATDVYALGVLLHELLLGERPERDNTQRPSLRARHLSGEMGALPAPLPSLRRLLKGDLDNIVLKALEPEPQRRYASAGAMADDVERHLQGQPVAAHPPSNWYRTHKFIRRHRGGVAVTVMLVLGIFASLGVALWQAHVANQSAARANAVQTFLLESIDAARARLPRTQRPTIDDMVLAARRRIERDAGLDQRTQAELLRVLGEVSLSAADFPTADALLSRALDVASRGSTVDESARWAIQLSYARLQLGQGQPGAALKTLEPLLADPRSRTRAALLPAYLLRAHALQRAGENDDAIAGAQAAVAWADANLGIDTVHALAARFALGDIQASAGKHAEARDTLRPAIARYEQLAFDADADLAAAMTALAYEEGKLGEIAAAIADTEKALALRRRIFNEPHVDIANSFAVLATLMDAQGDLPRAAELYASTLAMNRQLYGDGHPALVAPLVNAGFVESKRRRFDPALALFLEAKTICEARPDEAKGECPAVVQNVAHTYMQLGRFNDAEREAMRSLAMRREVFGPTSPEFANALSLLANIAIGAGRPDEALQRIEQAIALLDADPNAAYNTRVVTTIVRARALNDVRRHAEALAAMDAAITDWRTRNPQEKYTLIRMYTERCRALTALGRHDEARAAATEALGLELDPSQIKPEQMRVLQDAAGRQS